MLGINKTSLILILTLWHMQLLFAATTYPVTSNADTDTFGTLRYALNHASSGDTIRINDGLAVSLTANLPIITQSSLTITTTGSSGAGVTGNGLWQIFNAQAANININNLTLSSGAAVGENGGTGFRGSSPVESPSGGPGGGGGGAGLGGALFVATNASVTATNVSFLDSMATGGNGGSIIATGPILEEGGVGGGLNGGEGSGGVGGDPGTSGGNATETGGGGGGAGNHVNNTTPSPFGGSGTIGGAGGGGTGQTPGGFSAGSGGSGGFGAGNGATGANSLAANTGGDGGPGGGGAGMGGAIFVANGGSLTLNSTIDISGNSVQAGNPGSTLNVGDPQATAGQAISSDIFLDSNGGLTFGITSPLLISSNIDSSQSSSGGGLIMDGSSILTLTGTNTYTGGTTIESGTISIPSDTLGASAWPLTLSGGTLEASNTMTLDLSRGIVNITGTKSAFTADSGVVFTIGNSIASSGAITINGPGTVVFTGANSYSGGTTINSGTLRIDSDSNLGATTGSLTLAGGTLQAVTNPIIISGTRAISTTSTTSTIDINGENVTISSGITGNGGITLIDSGASSTLFLSGSSTYSGGTTISAGTLAIIGNGSLYSSGPVTIGSATFDISNANNAQSIGNLNGSSGSNVSLGSKSLTINSTGTSTFAGVISGSGGSLTKQGSGIEILSGANTYSGGTTVSAGTLRGTGTTSLQGAISVASGAILDFAQASTTTYSGSLSGTGTVDIDGGALIIFSGNNSSFSGNTAISNDSTLRGTGSNSLVGNISIAAGSTLDFAQASPSSYAGSLSGAGAVDIDGGSTITFSGNNSSFTGSTAISNDSTLRGTGTSSLVGNISVAAGSTLDFAQTSATTYAGSISGAGAVDIDGGSTITFSGNNSSFTGSTAISNDSTLRGTGTSSLVGNISIAAGSTLDFAQSSTTTYGGSLSGAGTVDVDGGSVIIFSGDNSGFTGNTAISLSSTLEGTGINSLVGNISITGSSTLNFAQSSTTTYAGNLSGSGTVDVDGGSVIIFSGDNSNFTGKTIISNNSTLEGTSTHSLVGNISVASGSILDFHQASATTYANTISGAGSVLVDGGGVITFTGANSYSGGTTIDASTLSISGSGSLSSSGALTLESAGIFDISTAINSQTIGTLNGSAGTSITLGSQALAVNPTSTSLFAGDISGSGGSLVKEGSGTLTLSGTNSYTGGTAILAGTLQGTGNNSSSLQGEMVIANGATLEFSQSSPVSYSGSLVSASGGGTVAIDGGSSITFSGDNSSFAGITNITNSSTLIGTGIHSLEGTFSIAGTSTLEFSQASPTSYAGSLMGSGSVDINGGSLVTFSGNNSSFTGSTFITNDSTLIGTASSSLVGNFSIGSGSSLDFSQTSPTSYAGALSGAGTVNIDGGTTITFSGNNSSLTGTTIISNDSTLRGTTSATSLPLAIDIESGSTLDFNQNIVFTYAGALSGAGSVDVDGGSTITFSGNNSSFTGTTTISNVSTLKGTGIHSLVGDFTVEKGSILDFNQASNTSYANTISGAGSVIVDGGGIITFSNSNTYSGGTNINAGTLSLSGSGSLLSTGAVTIGSGATFDISSGSNTTIGDLSSSFSNSFVTLGSNALTLGTSNSTTFAGTISGIGGSLIKQGSGTFTLSGTNTYTGPTTISAGTLSVNGSLTTSPITVGPLGTLGGTGTVGNVSIYGTLSPGNSIGTITGNTFTFLSGSTLLNELDPNGDTDFVHATTSITIDPGSTLLIEPTKGTFIEGTTYIIAEAPTITGTFTTINQPIPRFNAVVSYPSGGGMDFIEIFLSTNKFALILPSNATANAIATAAYIDMLENDGQVGVGSDLEHVITVMGYADAEQLAAGLDTMHPAPYASMMVAQENVTLSLTSTILDRLDELRILSCSCGAQTEQFHEWVTPIASYARQLSRGEQVGYHASTAGLCWGIDSLFGRNMCAGVAAAYTYSGVDWTTISTGKGYVQTGYLGVYGRYFNNLYYVDASILSGLNRYNAQRHIFMESSRDSINRYSGSVYRGIDCNTHLGAGVLTHGFADFSLFGSLDWVYLHQNSLREHGANSLDLDVSGIDANLVRSTLGFYVSKCYGPLVPEVGLAVAYDQRIGGSHFKSHFHSYEGTLEVTGLAPSQCLILPRAKLAAGFLSDKLTLELSYDAEISRSYFEHNFSLNIGYDF